MRSVCGSQRERKRKERKGTHSNIGRAVVGGSVSLGGIGDSVGEVPERVQGSDGDDQGRLEDGTTTKGEDSQEEEHREDAADDHGGV
jgi:hypothetical protein